MARRWCCLAMDGTVQLVANWWLLATVRILRSMAECRSFRTKPETSKVIA